MTLTGLESIVKKFPDRLKSGRIGVLCHAASITRDYRHIVELFSAEKGCRLAAIFGPQHGLFGQTQDNMIEWDGYLHPLLKIPVFSLYGKKRKPDPGMLSNIDLMVIDLQDVGARLYTYIWTVKLCIEACAEAGIPVWILDRPNPIGRLPWDGPILKEEYFTFVGGASIPLCHRMTIGEMALWIRDKYYPGADLKIVWMKDWHRNSLFTETGLPWVLPSPNMPTVRTAMVYPGTVLIEGLNISEGRGTVIPFELFGAPFLEAEKIQKELVSRAIGGCTFRVHNFIPTFNKFSGELCSGIQIHVTSPEDYYPVATALEIFDAIIETSGPGKLKFNPPPYEYENTLMPFDILSGDSVMRTSLVRRLPVRHEKERWREEINNFKKEFQEISAYPE